MRWGWGSFRIIPRPGLFRDLSGLIQQKVARAADEVFFMVSGLPQKIKGA